MPAALQGYQPTWIPWGTFYDTSPKCLLLVSMTESFRYDIIIQALNRCAR